MKEDPSNAEGLLIAANWLERRILELEIRGSLEGSLEHVVHFIDLAEEIRSVFSISKDCVLLGPGLLWLYGVNSFSM